MNNTIKIKQITDTHFNKQLQGRPSYNYHQVKKIKQRLLVYPFEIKASHFPLRCNHSIDYDGN